MDEAMANTKIEMSPIGIFHSEQVQPYEAGRQPDDFHSEGCIELFPGHNFEQALTGLEGCPRLWLIFAFHHNPHWNPMVLPPRGRNTKVGVFATRSPYRPNQIGMSCVRLLRIEKLKIYVAGADLLDGSPILDIKPYVAYADSFPGVEPEWLNEVQKQTVHFAPKALEQLECLENLGVNQLRGFLQHQLEYEPTNSKKKRVKSHGDHFLIAYRTWRAQFTKDGDLVTVQTIFSGYSSTELRDPDDPYSDKESHRTFQEKFPVKDGAGDAG